MIWPLKINIRFKSRLVGWVVYKRYALHKVSCIPRADTIEWAQEMDVIVLRNFCGGRVNIILNQPISEGAIFWLETSQSPCVLRLRVTEDTVAGALRSPSFLNFR